MRNSSSRIWISCAIMVLVICLCLSVVAMTLAVWYLSRAVLPQPVLPTPTKTPLSEQSSEEIARQMDEIEAQVIAIRGAQPTGPVARTLLTVEELRQRVLQDFLEDYSLEEAQEDARVLAAFGFLQADFDLYQFYLDLYSEQIAGYYDYEEKAMYVVQGVGFWGPERLTYAHEYAHVLQDQVYGIQEGLGYSDEACEQDSERCAAVRSLLEGDATLVETVWFGKYATAADQEQIFSFYDAFESPVYDSAPDFMKEDFIFPYTYGQAFVQSLFDHGGWQAVNRAFENVPVSTEQILHPERYPDDTPWPVSLLDFSSILGEGWVELDRDVMGEWFTYLMLAFGMETEWRVAENQAKQAAEGWGGDAYVVYYHPQEQHTVLLVKWLWESPVEAEQFARAFQRYADARFANPTALAEGARTWNSPDGVVEFHHNGNQTIWLMAPTPEVTQKLWNALEKP